MITITSGLRPRIRKVVLTLGLKSLGKGDQKITVEEGTVAKVELYLDGCIDGSVNNGLSKMVMDPTLFGSARRPDTRQSPPCGRRRFIDC